MKFDVASSGQRIYRLPVRVLPHLVGYVHLVLGNHPPLLVDAGSGEGESSEDIFDGLSRVAELERSFRPDSVRHILITHAHVDHFGGAADLSRRLNAEIWAHPLDSRVIESHDEIAKIFARDAACFLTQCAVPRELIPSIIEKFGFTHGRTPNVPVARKLVDGETLFDTMTVHHTPGHSLGHICVEIGEIFLLGDHILPRTIPQIWSRSLQQQESAADKNLAKFAQTGLAAYLHSLEKIATRCEQKPKAIGLAGHETPMENLPHRIELIRQNHRRREDRLCAILCKTPLTIFETTARLYTTTIAIKSLMAITDVAARIEYLVDNGALEIVAAEQTRYVSKK